MPRVGETSLREFMKAEEASAGARYIIVFSWRSFVVVGIYGNPPSKAAIGPANGHVPHTQ